jgi:predicted dehydrogenase
MPPEMHRRHFLGSAAALAAGTLARSSAASGAQEKLVVGVMGMGGRGTTLATGFERLPGVEVAYVCDVDRQRVERAAQAVEQVEGKPPKVVGDFRRILDDKDVDVLVIAASNHWHAPAAILGCSAGKHVYVEKPCSHNPHEGELMVAAARKHDRRVQMGNQRRSREKIIEGIQAVREGIVGRVYLARSWYNNNRPSLGRGQETAPPEHLDYELWQGPAPRRPYRDNVIHYNWHWFWHWGNGELGNNGVHTIDVCRWGLGVDYPVHVTSSGGRYQFQDDQETPDTHVVAFDFPDRKTITWTGLSCNRHRPEVAGAVAAFHGEKGTVLIMEDGYLVLDEQDKEIRRERGGRGGEAEHLANFVEAIRSGAPLNSEIEEGHQSTLLCHLGNIAHRTGRSVKCDPHNGRILDDAAGMRLWQREYASGWEPRV